MVWFRVDDVLTFHPRVLEAGNAAIGLWVRAGAWSMAQLTDGFIPVGIAKQLGTAAEIKRLVAAGLWVAVEGGYQFHAWAAAGDGTARQPTREQVHEKRANDRARKRKEAKAGADARWNRDGDDADSTRNPPGLPPDSTRNPPGFQAASDAPVPSRPQDPHLESVSHVPERESYPQDDDERAARARRDAYWRGLRIGQPTRVIALIGQVTDRPVDEQQAIQIVSAILTRAKTEPKDAQAYIESSVRKSWVEIQRDLDAAAVAA